MQAIVDTLASFYNALVAFISGIANSIGQALQNVINAVLTIPKYLQAAYDAVIAWLTSFKDSLAASIKKVYDYIASIPDGIIKIYDNIYHYLTDFALSIKDFITDLPVTLLKYATDFITKFLDWASTYCSYCMGGATSGGGGGSVSKFAQSIQSAYDALSPCVKYALTQSGIVGDLQILSCAMVIWSAFRVVALVRSIA